MTTFKRDTLNEANSCAAYDAFDRAVNTWGDNKDCINLTAGDQIVVDGQLGTYTVGSVIACALEDNKDPIAAFERAVGFGHQTIWINQNCTVLTAHDRAKEKMIVVTIGMLVFIEGKRFKITREANNNLGLEAA